MDPHARSPSTVAPHRATLAVVARRRTALWPFCGGSVDYVAKVNTQANAHELANAIEQELFETVQVCAQRRMAGGSGTDAARANRGRRLGELAHGA